MYTDDTNVMMLKKIAQYCSPLNLKIPNISVNHILSEGNNKSSDLVIKMCIHPND